MIDQLTARGVMEASALYESLFTDIDTGGPKAVFGGKDDIVDGILELWRRCVEN